MSDKSNPEGGKTAQVDTLLVIGGRVVVVRAGQLLPADDSTAVDEPDAFGTDASNSTGDSPDNDSAAADAPAQPTPSKPSKSSKSSKSKGAKS